MRYLLILASSLMLASAQYPILTSTLPDPSAANDYDLNRLITQVLNQAEAIQPEFSSIEQQPDISSSQRLSSQNQYVAPESSGQNYGLPSKQNQVQESHNAPQRGQDNNQYGTPSQNNEYIAPPRPKQTYSPTPSRQNSNRVRNELLNSQSSQSQNHVVPVTQAIQRNEYNSQSSRKNSVKSKYNAPTRGSDFNAPQSSRQNQVEDEYGAPEQQELKELTDLLNQFGIPPTQASFSGRSQQQQQQQQQRGGGYSSPTPPASVQPTRSSSNKNSNDLAGAASGGYYNDESAHNALRGDSEGAHIKKFVYIHTAPPEAFPAPRPRPRQQKPPPPPDTHYNIIFIKAPSPPQEEQKTIELPLPPEQKTLVYVLLKKPEPPPEIRIPTPKPTPPSKPEVYFIRYTDNKAPLDEDDAPRYDDEPELGSQQLEPFPAFGGNPRNAGGGYDNNEAAYSEPKKVSSSKKSASSLLKSQQTGRSHYTAPGSRPFENESRVSQFKPVNIKSGARSQSQRAQSVSSGGY